MISSELLYLYYEATIEKKLGLLNLPGLEDYPNHNFNV